MATQGVTSQGAPGVVGAGGRYTGIFPNGAAPHPQGRHVVGFTVKPDRVGQGNNIRIREFTDHAVVRLQLPGAPAPLILDPSYGATYQAPAAEMTWEDASIESIGFWDGNELQPVFENRPNTPNVQEFDFEPSPPGFFDYVP